MEDDSDQGCYDSDDDVHVPMTTATPMVEMDGEEGENAATDAIMNTGVKIILFRQNTHPAHVDMGRVGATAITCTHRCRWFWFCFIVVFPCCFLPSMKMFMSFW